jgi:DNA-directed RNA polymerase specialized sigma24 family protein
MKVEVLRRRFLKVVKEARVKGKRYEEIAVEIGISLDTMRKFMYNPKRNVSELTLKKIKNWINKTRKEEVGHEEGVA